MNNYFLLEIDLSIKREPKTEDQAWFIKKKRKEKEKENMNKFFIELNLNSWLNSYTTLCIFQI